MSHRPGLFGLLIASLFAAHTATGQVEVERIFWADVGDDVIRSRNPDGIDVQTVVADQDGAWAVRVDPAGRKIYWSTDGDEGDGTIRRANYDGTGVEDVVSDVDGRVMHIALDLPNDRVYWVTDASRVDRANLDGTGIETIFADINGEAVEVAGGSVYFGDDGGDSVIWRTDPDGSNPVELGSDVGFVQSLRADLENGHLYWTDEARVRRMDLDGSNIVNLVTGGIDFQGNALDLPGGKIYWSDRATNAFRRADLDGSNPETLFIVASDPFGFDLLFTASCSPTPLPACQTAQSNSLKIKDDASDGSKGRLTWKSSKANEAIAQSDFGDPVAGGNAYSFCTYDAVGGASILVSGADVPGGRTCGGTGDRKICWKATGDTGYKYKDKDGSSDGITKILLKGGEVGKGKIQVKGKGSNLPLPGSVNGQYFATDPDVIVRVTETSTGNCWGSTFGAADAKKNEAESYKAKNK